MPLRVVFPIALSDGDNGPDQEVGFIDANGGTTVADLYPGTHEIYPGSSYSTDNLSSPLYFQHVGNLASKVVFEATDATHGRELWVTDGTTAGTNLLMDINPAGDAFSTTPNPSSNYGAMSQPFNGSVYFAANDGTDGTELWKTDGTAAGTKMVDDINPGAGGSAPSSFTVAGNTLFFTANDGVHDVELWKTDGTAAGTQLVIDIKTVYAYYSSGSNPTDLTAVGNELYFAADDGTNGVELWKSDGTAAGTVLVKNINTTTGMFESNSSSNPTALTAVGNELYFAANDGTHGSELWKSNGTSAGTVMVKDIMPGSGNSNIDDMVNLDGELIFFADDGIHGYELWKSNGTAAGTVMIADLNPVETGTGTASAGNFGATDLTVADNLVFFVATNGINGDELWQTDGTATGTKMVANLNMYGSSTPEQLTAAGGYLYFTAFDGSTGGAAQYSLYKTNGVTTTLVTPHDYNSGNGFNNFAVIGDQPVTDFDDDGHSDILLDNSSTGQLSIWTMNGGIVTDSGKAGSALPAGWKAVGTGDFNEDGRADILLQNTATGQASIWLMNGTTKLAGGGQVGSAPGANFKLVGSGDFNGDGQSDILWENTTTGQASIWLMNGTSVAGGSGKAGMALGSGWTAVDTGDFNGDGKSDILWQNTTTGQATIWLMNGNTKLAGSGQVGSAPGANVKVIGTGDFNGDGKADILWENTTTGQASIWLMDGTSRLAGSGSAGSAQGAAWKVIGAADYNGDGKSDILWQNSSTGQVMVWLMDGTTKLAGSGQVGSSLGTAWHAVA